MKHNITLSLLTLLLWSLPLFAAAPTVSASNMTYSNVDGGSFTVGFTRGNGAGRIVVVREGSPVTGMPVNGVDYTANANFGTAGSEFSVPGEFVVFRGTFNSVSISKLKPSTTYYISVFEYNGSGSNIEYLMVPLNGSQSTITTPTQQAVITSITEVAGNSVTVNWTNGNGGKRLLLARKGAPVSGMPEDQKAYSSSTDFGSGAAINGDNYVVYSGSNAKITVDKLEPNTTYHFALFEFAGSSVPMYRRPGSVASVTTHAGPTVASKNISFSDIEGNRLSMGFTQGNGAYQLVIARKGAPVTAVPQNGQTYTPNTAFGQGTEIEPGQFVMYTTGINRVFTNLEPYTTYHFRVYDFDVDGNGQTYYLTSAWAEKSQSTAVAPTVQASALSFINVTGTTATLKFTQGNGNYRLTVIKEGGPVDALPADLVKYSASSVFGSGTQVAPGNYVVGSSNSSQVNITNLLPGRTYHAAIFEFNGQDYPVYLKPGATSSVSIPAQPTQPSSTFTTTYVEGNAFQANWVNGNGAKRLVIARKGAAVTARPQDGVTYTANTAFGLGQQVADGEFVVFDGTNNNFDLANLEIGATYHVAIFDYNPSSTGPDYLTSSFLAGSATTVVAPTQQATVNATNVQSSSATITYVKGNGAGRLFIMREGSPVNVDPQDLVSYNYNAVFGQQQIGVGNYAVQRTTGAGSNFQVSGLAPSTLYYVAVFEFNGSSAPVYLRPAGTFSFTTSAGTGVTTPTTAATSATFANVEGNGMKLSWLSGNGANRIVVARQGEPVNFSPVNGTAYTANASFGAGTDLGNGQFVLYNGNNNFVNVTGLQPATTYHFAVFEFNGSGSTTRYLTSSFLAASNATAAPPPAGSTGVVPVAGNTSITLNWNAGPGSGRLVVMKEGSAINTAPANLSAYPASAVFGNGAQIAAGVFVVYASSGSSVTVTGLLPNKTYYYSIFEYNGLEAPVYNTTNVLSGSAITGSTLPVKWVSFNAKENNNEVLLE
ncbi:MAG TPA: hypothetical protein VD996_16375, partial [Chitinophagaceae bacterium]|nr:hypothetical protein [Chitinophagaceae bacterium]